jgi:hypothetical protein
MSQFYIYSPGFVYVLQPTGLQLATSDIRPQKYSYTQDAVTGEYCLQLFSSSVAAAAYLNFSSNGITTSSKPQALVVLPNGLIQLHGTKSPSFVSISSSTPTGITLTDSPVTWWNLVTIPNTSVFSAARPSIYNSRKISYYPYEHSKLTKMFNAQPDCEGDNCSAPSSGSGCPIASKKSVDFGGDKCDQSQCPAGLQFIGCDPGGFGRHDQAYCYRSSLADTNLNECALGDSSVLDGDSINFCSCKLQTPQVQISNHCFNKDGSDGCIKAQFPLQSVAVAPWSADVQNSSAIKEYCMQHDSATDGPLMFSDSRCLNWATQDKARYTETMDQYCRQHPESSFCASFCALQPANSTTCNWTMSNWCSGDNLEKPECVQWCQHPNVNCDKALKNVCTPEKLRSNPELCGCFMQPSFYQTFFESLKNQVDIPASTSDLPQCYFPQCAASPLQPYAVKNSQKSQCPNVQTCIADVKFTNEGIIDGNVTIEANNLCGWNSTQMPQGPTGGTLGPTGTTDSTGASSSTGTSPVQPPVPTPTPTPVERKHSTILLVTSIALTVIATTVMLFTKYKWVASIILIIALIILAIYVIGVKGQQVEKEPFALRASIPSHRATSLLKLMRTNQRTLKSALRATAASVNNTPPSFLRFPYNQYYYLYTKDYRSLNVGTDGSVQFSKSSSPTQWYYIQHPFRPSSGMLMSDTSILTYTVDASGLISMKALPAATTTPTANSEVILSWVRGGGQLLVMQNNILVSTAVNSAAQLTITSSLDSPFYFSTIPLPISSFEADLWSCSQFDAVNNQPYYKTNAACGELVQDQKAALVNSYCSKFPLTSDGECSKVCSSPNEVCFQGMKMFCQSDNLLTPECQSYCNSPDANCDQSLQQYCSQFTPNDLISNPDLQNACGCFLPSQVYDNFFQSFNSLVNSSNTAVRPKISSCWFPMCSANSAVKPYAFKKNKTVCPSIQECVSITQIDNQGTIKGGDINIKINNDCNFSLRTSL